MDVTNLNGSVYRKVNIEKPIDFMKSKMEETINSLVGLAGQREINHLANTYMYYPMGGGVMCGGKMNITLNKIDENTTEVSIACSNLSASLSSEATLNSYMDDFLKNYSLILNGQVLKRVEEHEKHGGLKIALAIITLICIIAAIVLLVFL